MNLPLPHGLDDLNDHRRYAFDGVPGCALLTYVVRDREKMHARDYAT